MPLLRLHDALTRAGFFAGAASLIGIFGLYNFEVAARYLFNSPTKWSGDLVSYLLCAMIGLVLPELTRVKSHIAITFVGERMGPANQRRLGLVLGPASGIVCLTAAWIVGDETLRLYAGRIETIATFIIPKWWLAALLTYGLASSGLYFLRTLPADFLRRREAAP
jgi:TRAP-type C4-dicarboxylate transport system permease small subunit